MFQLDQKKKKLAKVKSNGLIPTNTEYTYGVDNYDNRTVIICRDGKVVTLKQN